MADIVTILSTDSQADARIDINANFLALQNTFASSVAPASPVAYQLWLDITTTTAPILKQRNSTNAAWVTLIPNTLATTGGFLATTGGTMSGVIAMGSQKITGLANGTASGDVINKGQADGKILVSATTVAAWAATLNRPIFIAPASCTIVRVYLLTDTTTAGSGAGARHDFQVRNVGTGGAGTTDMLSVAKTTNGAEITAYASYNLGADQNLTMAVGEGLQLRITVTGAPTSLASANVVCVVHYSVAV